MSDPDKKVVTTTVQFTPEMYARLQSIRDRTGKSLRQVVNELVQQEAERLEKEGKPTNGSMAEHDFGAAHQRYDDDFAERFFNEIIEGRS